MIPGIHFNVRPAANETIEGQTLSSQGPVSTEPHVQNVMHSGSGSQSSVHEVLSKVLNMQLTKLFIYSPFTLCIIFCIFVCNLTQTQRMGSIQILCV